MSTGVAVVSRCSALLEESGWEEVISLAGPCPPGHRRPNWGKWRAVPGTRVTNEPMEDEHPYFPWGFPHTLWGHGFIPKEKGSA